jgi:hypothetical protein
LKPNSDLVEGAASNFPVAVEQNQSFYLFSSLDQLMGYLEREHTAERVSR